MIASPLSPMLFFWVHRSFGLTTLTTVGLGDITPVTPQGRLVVCGSILLGVAIIPAQAAKLIDIFVEAQKDQQERRQIRKTKAVRISSSDTNATVNQRMQSAINGKGPSGVAIEIPPKDKLPSSLSGRKCGRCGSSPHRTDASFCWSCGAEL